MSKPDPDPKRAIDLPGWRALRPRSNVKTPLSVEQIVATAIAIVDTEGLEALSMRRLGKELGSGATSLYWHVKDKDELLDLILDEIIGEVMSVLEPAADWRTQLRDAAWAYRRILLKHHRLAPIMGERPTLGPHALDAIEWLLGLLRQEGFDDVTAALAANAVINLAGGFAVFEARDPLIGPGISAEQRAVLLEGLAEQFGSLPPDRYPNAIALAPVTSQLGADEQFGYALERLLDGIVLDRERRQA